MSSERGVVVSRFEQFVGEDAMERKLFQVAVGLTWLALPLTALNYWRAWDRLPPRMAVHFDVNWQPNG